MFYILKINAYFVHLQGIDPSGGEKRVGGGGPSVINNFILRSNVIKDNLEVKYYFTILKLKFFC